jgi:S-adenosylmethionine/arginine decarboxylase-like enzyme
MNTRKNKNKSRNSEKIQHHHMLLRAETQTCPSSEDKASMERKIHQLIKDIDMASLAPVQTYYVTNPHYNEGLTGIAPIQTSHIALHFWKNPDVRILNNKQSNCLLQMDIYTCGKLTGKQIAHVLKTLEEYTVTHADITVLNRRRQLHIDRAEHWDASEPIPWDTWIQDRF